LVWHTTGLGFVFPKLIGKRRTLLQFLGEKTRNYWVVEGERGRSKEFIYISDFSLV